MTKTVYLCMATGLLLTATAVRAGDWPQFRGPGGTGVGDETGLPERWSAADGLRWKADLPGRGLSSPVIAGGKVYVTACSGPLQERLHVLCFNVATGKKEWERQLWALNSIAPLRSLPVLHWTRRNRPLRSSTRS